MAVFYHVTVYNSQISVAIQTDGRRFTRAQAWQFRALAVDEAPKQSGRLAASHLVQQNRDEYTGRFQVGFNITAEAFYAGWVYEGTGIYGPRRRKITPRRKKAMKLPAGYMPRGLRQVREGGKTRAPLVSSIKGQRSNKWMDRAAARMSMTPRYTSFR